jgi:hypothetical protein
MTRWPWLVTPTDVAAAPARYDVERGVAQAVATPPGYRQTSCGPSWCLAAGDAGAALLRPDGSDQRPVGGPGTQPVTGEVALLNRYAPLLVGQRLMLYDIVARRSILVAPSVTGTGSDGRYLWWSTGDREALRWYGLDVADLR